MEKRDRNPNESECVSCGWKDIKFKDVFASNKYGGFHDVCHSLLFLCFTLRSTKTKQSVEEGGSGVKGGSEHKMKVNGILKNNGLTYS